MTLISVGINHNTAPVAIREHLAFPADTLKKYLKNLCDNHKIYGIAILSTCNRTEFYCQTEHNNSTPLIDWITKCKNLHTTDFTPYLYTHINEQSIRHIFRVACGLDSMILGEPQILGQMKTAYKIAHSAGTLSKHLNKLFHHTFSAAKKVRTNTAIGKNPISIAFAAVQLARQIFSSLNEQTALLIGAGENVELLARHLQQNGIGKLIIANRTLYKAQALATKFNGYAITLSAISLHLSQADIVITSTASQLPILGKGRVESAIKKRKHKPMFMVDLSVPRDIESEVSQLADAYVYTIDDLHNTTNRNLDSRHKSVTQAEEIIDLEIENFLVYIRSQSTQTIIKNYRQQAELTRNEALTIALKQLNNGHDAETVLNRLAYTLTNKLIHNPSVQLRIAGANNRRDIIAAAEEIFKLTK